jgi:hypothetical protein
MPITGTAVQHWRVLPVITVVTATADTPGRAYGQHRGPDVAAERTEVRLTGSPLAASRLRHEVVYSLKELRLSAKLPWNMGETPGQDLSDLPVACPLCHQVHHRCRFTSGTLYCIRPRCGNPHHRGPHPSPANVHPAHQ